MSYVLRALMTEKSLISAYSSASMAGVTWRLPHTVENQEQPRGYGWVRNRDGLSRTVRYLLVQASGSGVFLTPNVYPYVDDHMSEREKLLSSRAIPSEKLNLRQVGGWLSTCKMLHTHKCDSGHWTNMAVAGIRLIDVENRCVITPGNEVTYCALSYCWGTKPFLKLKSADGASLYKKNALSTDCPDLPKTIKDAMYLTSYLGIRYLWVDALCILQDNEANKKHQLPLMEKIYRHATLTVVAAAGEDPSTGLPGLHAGARRIRQFSQRVGKVWLYASSEKLTRGDRIAQSIWSNRAWTLQEHALSVRLLIFTPSEVFWECDCSVWNEGVHLEASNCEGTEIERKYPKERMKKHSPDFTAFQSYAFFINQVSARKISFENDRIDCVRGLLENLSRDVPGGFIWGHPIAAFDSSLLFSPGVYSKAPHTRREGFPSWTWAGWHFVVTSNVTGPYDSGFNGERFDDTFLYGSKCPKYPFWMRREVAWFHLDDAAKDWTEIQSSWISEDGSAFYAESKRLWEQANPRTFLNDARRKLLDANISSDQALAFWTQRVHLSVDRLELHKNQTARLHGIARIRGSRDFFPIRDNLNRVIGFINLTEEYRISRPDKLEFILIAQNRRWEHKLGPLLDLLGVETIAGVTFRVQNIRDSVVRLGDWQDLGPKWELIIMA